MSRPIVAIINQKALKNNLSIVRKMISTAQLWAVVKANAYGHGIKRIWKSLCQADGFALLSIHEALLLRDSGWQKPILLLEGFFHPNDIKILAQYNLTTVVHSQWQIKALAKAKLLAPLHIYLKMNCGMNRLGFQPDDIHSVWQQLKEIKSIGTLTLMAHFANAENAEGVIEPMQKIYQASKNLNCQMSLANSAAILLHPQTHLNWVRPGIILYGAFPKRDGNQSIMSNSGFEPVMTLNSKIIAIQEIASGSTVGYDNSYRANCKQRIGIVACGYADGYPRHAPSGTPVKILEHMTKTIGTVSMDMMAIDLTLCPQAYIGSKVELWGKNVKIDDVATASKTVGYELMCALSPRVPVQLE
ncbi:alanine racemase [Candidatus Erwinia haradaeae]|uniref:Alanine racemase n=1 Tax=Candidatus Erwinia haradaeae TaxID=1922217 RepID=A0A451D352_9GAMM|nr:alanine racemase [Candidatus Erwinia haradaeae]VFP80078.1 Alanine racemase, catabolic [Candidatus Erwinia haradaeae]